MLGENVEQAAWIYALAAHEYYWGDGTHQILTDSEYDSLTRILQIYWSEIPEELKKIFVSKELLGQGAVQIQLTPEEVQKAVEVHRIYDASQRAREAH